MSSVNDVLESLEKLTVVEIIEVVKALEEKWGVKAAVVSAGGGGGGSDQDGGAAEEKSSFDIFITAVGPKKIAVIKALKDILGVGLGEAKAFVENLDKPIKTNVPTAEANEIADKIKAEGAEVDLK